jgi:tetratricopeptide (TPR) repeat protein
MKLGSLILLALLAVWPNVAAAVSDEVIATLHQDISNWQTYDVRQRLDRLIKADPGSAGLRFIEARLLYFEGRYGDSVNLLDALLSEMGEGAPKTIVNLREEVARTYETLKDFDEVVTADQRFLIRFEGKDRVLVPYLIEVLQAADKALSEDFAWAPKGQVLVEIYPAINYLAKVSPLTEEAIETSGTIALCKYNRLMFTSPRGLVKGYGWRDTVAHEFVHYYVTKKSENTVPIWLHEGIAKFQEVRWRTEPGEHLGPPQEDLLARSLKADQLVTFQQMHPSMALLPSQEAAALAFAEVHLVIDYLHGQKGGYGKLNQLIGRLRAGADMDRALSTVYGVTLDGLWNSWKAVMLKKGFKTYPGLVQTKMKFKRPGQPEADEDALTDYGTIEEKKVKDLAHLGELLRARDRFKASLKEYQKAMVLGGDGNPMIQNGAARAMLQTGGHAKIPETLKRVQAYYPTYLTTWLNLGEAHLALNQPVEAIAAFEQAVGINPFHPRPHEALAKLYAAAGAPDRAAQATKSLELLR